MFVFFPDGQGRPGGAQGFDHAGVDSAMDQPVRLQVPVGNLHFSDIFIRCGFGEMQPHGIVETAEVAVDQFEYIFREGFHRPLLL